MLLCFDILYWACEWLTWHDLENYYEKKHIHTKSDFPGIWVKSTCRYFTYSQVFVYLSSQCWGSAAASPVGPGAAGELPALSPGSAWVPAVDPGFADAASLGGVLSRCPPAPPHTASGVWSGWLNEYKINPWLLSIGVKWDGLCGLLQQSSY